MRPAGTERPFARGKRHRRVPSPLTISQFSQAHYSHAAFWHHSYYLNPSPFKTSVIYLPFIKISERFEVPLTLVHQLHHQPQERIQLPEAAQFLQVSTDEHHHQFISRRLSKNRRYLRFDATPILRLCRKESCNNSTSLPTTQTPKSPRLSRPLSLDL